VTTVSMQVVVDVFGAPIQGCLQLVTARAGLPRRLVWASRWWVCSRVASGESGCYGPVDYSTCGGHVWAVSAKRGSG
jgi:hypothetical protein